MTPTSHSAPVMSQMQTDTTGATQADAVASLVDCLRHRPVATTAAQMREAADLIERAVRLSAACAALNKLDGADTAAEQLAEPDAAVVREYRAAVAAFALVAA